jgi:hypothetical protein
LTPQDEARALLRDLVRLGRLLGYKDFKRGIHDTWIHRMVWGKADMTLQAHRGSYKTTCLCVAIALLMIKERGKNIIFLRKTDSDVAEVVSNVARILQEPVFCQMYRALSGEPLALLKNTGSELTTSAYNAPKGSAQLQGIGTGGSLTGKHADIIITDDIVNLRDRISRAERERTKAIYQELQNIRNPGGRIINTGTPWHPDDAFTLMPEPDRWDYTRTGLLDAGKIEALRRSMAPSLFAANYELRHIAAENALFDTPPQFITQDMALEAFGDHGTPADFLRDGIAHIDAAYGGEDYTAFTCGKRIGDKLYLYGRLWHTHVDTVLDAALAEAGRLMCGPVYSEDNGDKGFLAREIRRAGGKPAVYHEHENKYLKISTFLRKWWDNIIWLEGTDREYLDQITGYTEDAEHDDAPDSAACVCRYYDRRSGQQYKSALFGGMQG